MTPKEWEDCPLERDRGLEVSSSATMWIKCSLLGLAIIEARLEIGARSFKLL